jgi:carbon monoxide dehydrogenase subunit G
MELKGERIISATVDTTWAALNDPIILKECIVGCESLERSSQDAFKAVLAVKIGPVSARFKGNLHMTDTRPPHAYTINFDGQGGVAGFGKGSVEVSLSADPAGTRLSYIARASVGGKVAQLGSRLVDAAAAKMADDFFKEFESKLSSGAATANRMTPDPAAILEELPQSSSIAKWMLWIGGATFGLLIFYLLMRL